MNDGASGLAQLQPGGALVEDHDFHDEDVRELSLSRLEFRQCRFHDCRFD